MFLLEGGVLPKVFAVYAAFWTVVIVGAFLAVGALIKKAERIREKNRHASGEGH
jgi:hypothetical protein